ncbi:hypothetical protein BGW39_010183 [Mortierella sp. 14UC]|nr:hypothetical protein BGW39_010183 [Mortierella sp. 14UC]
MASIFTFTFNMPIRPPPQPQPQFRALQQATPERQDDLMDSFIDYNQAAAVASLEQLLSTPSSLVDYSSPDDSEILLLSYNNNDNAVATTASATQNVVLNNPHAYLHSQRQYLFSTYDFTNNSRTPNKVVDTRQECCYPGLELSSSYEDNLDSLYFDRDGLELLDFSENTIEFDVQEYLRMTLGDAVAKFEYTAIPSIEEQVSSLFPDPVLSYDDKSAVSVATCCTAIPLESVPVVNMDVDSVDEEDDEEAESDNESDCESDDDEYVPVTAPMTIPIFPTPSVSPPPSVQPYAPSLVLTTVEKPKIPRSRAKKGEKRIHACHECRREFTRACNLQSHILTHSNLKPYSCTECDKTFARVYDMQRHRRIHSNKLEDKPYSCPDCTIRFKRTEPRNRHRQTVHGWIPPPAHKQ